MRSDCMISKKQTPDINAIDQNLPEVTQPVNAEDLPPSTFLCKFRHDWSPVLASALAYNLLTSAFFITLVFLCTLGIILGRLDPHMQDKLIIQLQALFPHTLLSGNAIRTIFHQLTSLS